MSPSLRDLRGCFEGVIPSIIATLSADGEPNISYLSHVHFVDDAHVALSNQFFSKTAANVEATGRATVLVVDARSGEQFLLSLRYLKAVEGGELFERIAAQLRATSSREGMGEIMRLRSADLYEVEAVEAVDSPPQTTTSATAPPRADRLSAAARLTAELAAEQDADAMLDRALDGLVGVFGFSGAMVLSPDESGRRLVLLASRGYVGETVGSEIAIGEGTIGIAAESGRAVRLSDMSRGRRFEQAVLSGGGAATAPLLPRNRQAQSQLAAPMISRDQLYGVLFLESEQRFAFSHDDEDALVLIAGQMAANLRLLELEGREAGGEPESRAPPSPRGAGGPRFTVRYYAFDDSVFIDDAYVVKGVAGRLLYHLIADFAATGRREFTNREMRLDPRLRLPGVKDNLETRLILLRRRLEERAAPVRLQRLGRGLVGLELSGAPVIEAVTDAP